MCQSIQPSIYESYCNFPIASSTLTDASGPFVHCGIRPASDHFFCAFGNLCPCAVVVIEIRILLIFWGFRKDH